MNVSSAGSQYDNYLFPARKIANEVIPAKVPPFLERVPFALQTNFCQTTLLVTVTVFAIQKLFYDHFKDPYPSMSLYMKTSLM